MCVFVSAGGTTNQTDELSLAQVDFKTDILQNILNSSGKHIMEFVISSIGKNNKILSLLIQAAKQEYPETGWDHGVTAAKRAHSTSCKNYVFVNHFKK